MESDLAQIKSVFKPRSHHFHVNGAVVVGFHADRHVMFVNQHPMIRFRRGFLRHMLGREIQLMSARLRKQSDKFLQFFKWIHRSKTFMLGFEQPSETDAAHSK